VSHPLISSWIAVSVGHAEMISVGSVTINSYLGGKDGEILKTVSVTLMDAKIQVVYNKITIV
jgi:hypothetical protein